MVSLTDLIAAEDPEQYAALLCQFQAEQAAKPSTSEVLTSFMRDCTHMQTGEPLLESNEYADLVDSKITIRKLN